VLVAQPLEQLAGRVALLSRGRLVVLKDLIDAAVNDPGLGQVTGRVRGVTARRRLNQRLFDGVAAVGWRAIRRIESPSRCK
jgi:hypothetical protein